MIGHSDLQLDGGKGELYLADISLFDLLSLLGYQFIDDLTPFINVVSCKDTICSLNKENMGDNFS